ncbi:MAG: DNA-3-methyladenine glycosylase II, partial [uncultured Phycisphaerae bacterium]
MWFERPPGVPDWSEAESYLRRADPALGAVIDRVGPCTLAPRRDYFVVLCKAIFTQQISTAVATTLFGRFRDLFPNRRPTPARVIEVLGRADPAVLRGCGLSRQKTSYLADLAQHLADGRIPTRRLAGMDDEAVIEALVGVRGIGRWTAEMFLIFTLNRPDVFPVGDLGVVDGLRDVFNLPARPTPAEALALGERWRPYRSIATWYLWRRGSVPVAAPAVPVPDAVAGAPPCARRRRPRPAAAPGAAISPARPRAQK